jgi:ureidoglycolate hydrolase
MPQVRRVPVRPLEPNAFARYGSIVEAGAVDDPSLNRAPGQMAFMWVHRDLQYPRMPFIATCRYRYRGVRCEYVQRHPGSTVVLIPIDRRPSVIWFLPDANGLPDTEHADAILLDGTRGIVVAPNTWIRYAYPVTDTADFAYVSARVDPEEDIERVYLESDHDTVLEWHFDLPVGEGIETTPGGAVLNLPLPTGQTLNLGVGGVIVRNDAARAG